MKQSVWSKIAGWSQFALQVLIHVTQSGSNGVPHGVWNWIGLGASLATAIAVHGASGTDGSK